MASLINFSDEELVSLLRDGNSHAFTEIYDRFSGLLYIYAFKLTGDDDTTADLLQEVFTSLWERREKLEIRSSLSAYLYTAVRFQFLKAIEKNKVRTSYSITFLAEFKQELTADDYIVERELVAFIEAFVKQLPPQMQRVFTLSRFQHLTNQEIAEELDISEKTVRNLLSESLRTLKPKVGVGVLLLLLHQL